MRIFWNKREQVLELTCETPEDAKTLRMAMRAMNVGYKLPYNDFRVLDWDGPRSTLPTIRLEPVNK